MTAADPAGAVTGAAVVGDPRSGAVSSHTAQLDGLRMHWLEAGTGSPVVLLHGIPQHAHMWRPVITGLADRHRVIAPDLRGSGATQVTDSGYDKTTMAGDVHQLLTHLRVTGEVGVVGHDMGAGVAYAYAAAHRTRVRRLALLEFAFAGFGLELAMTPGPDVENWQLGFFATAPDMAERLFTGRERDLLSWYFTHASDNPDAVGLDDVEQYLRPLLRPGALRAMTRYFAATWVDADANRATAQVKLSMPVLAVGGSRSAGDAVRAGVEQLADHVRGEIIDHAGHWLVDEQPAAVLDLLRTFPA